MYKNIFDNHLRKGDIFSAYMFWGQDDFFIEHYATKVALSFAPSSDIQKIYFDEYNYETCMDILSQSSLFLSTNIVLIKLIKKIPKKEIDNLIKVCNINKDTHIIFACLQNKNPKVTTSVDFKSMAKSFNAKTSSAEVRFFTPQPTEAIKILQDEAKKQNTNFEQNALIDLYAMHEKDLSLCISDISKLSILQETITTNIVKNQCFGMGTVLLDSFLNNLFLGNRYKKDLFKILEEGVNEIYLINQITSFVQQLFIINIYLKLYGNLNILEIWGYPLPQDIAKQRANIAMRYTQNQYTSMLKQLLNLELELKSAKIIDTNSYIQAYIRKFSATFS
jgi:DNA polymerase-3 subunit delta